MERGKSRSLSSIAFPFHRVGFKTLPYGMGSIILYYPLAIYSLNRERDEFKTSTMPSIEMSIPHKLTQEEAQRRIQELLPKMKSDFGGQVKDLREEWNGNTGKFSFTAMGFSVSGTLTVNDSSVDLDGDLPFAATLFKGKIKSVIEEKAQQILK